MNSTRSKTFTFLTFIFVLGLALPSFSEPKVSRRQFAAVCVGAVAAYSVYRSNETEPFAEVSWEIVGRDSATPAFLGITKIEKPSTVGDFTIQILKDNEVPFVGNASGLHSILGTPIGDDAIEVIDDKTLKAYGWCYEVNGVQPDVMPDKFDFVPGKSHLRWFYAYSLYKNGEWVSFCEPAHGVQ